MRSLRTLKLLVIFQLLLPAVLTAAVTLSSTIRTLPAAVVNGMG